MEYSNFAMGVIQYMHQITTGKELRNNDYQHLQVATVGVADGVEAEHILESD